MLMYRYSDRYAVLCLQKFEVKRITSHGKVVNANGKDRFILNDSRKRFAHEEKSDALTSFLARKKRQMEILLVQIERVKSAISIAESNTPDTLQPYHPLDERWIE